MKEHLLKTKTMKRPKINDYKPSEIHCGDDMAKWYMDFSNEQELYIEWLESRIDNSVKSDYIDSKIDYLFATTANHSTIKRKVKELIFSTLKQESNTDSHLEPCKHEGQEIPSKTIICKHCGNIETITGFTIDK